MESTEKLVPDWAIERGAGGMPCRMVLMGYRRIPRAVGLAKSRPEKALVPTLPRIGYSGHQIDWLEASK